MSNVDEWIEEQKEKNHTKALEKASTVFDEKDSLTVHTLEAICGQESSFGTRRMGSRNSTEPAGYFQLEKATAKELGMQISKTNDERFDIDQASYAAAKYLKNLDEYFQQKTNLGEVSTVAITDELERKYFVLAAYNAGQGRIAKAQNAAKQAGKDPTKWSEVKLYLRSAGASAPKEKETTEYVEKVLQYEKEFSQKSPANKALKNKRPNKESTSPTEILTGLPTPKVSIF